MEATLAHSRRQIVTDKGDGNPVSARHTFTAKWRYFDTLPKASVRISATNGALVEHIIPMGEQSCYPHPRRRAITLLSGNRFRELDIKWPTTRRRADKLSQLLVWKIVEARWGLSDDPALNGLPDDDTHSGRPHLLRPGARVTSSPTIRTYWSPSAAQAPATPSHDSFTSDARASTKRSRRNPEPTYDDRQTKWSEPRSWWRQWRDGSHRNPGIRYHES